MELTQKFFSYFIEHKISQSMTKSKNSSKYAESVWMINKARDCITKGDPYSAKAWLLTAKSLFPGSFAIQVLAFCCSVP